MTLGGRSHVAVLEHGQMLREGTAGGERGNRAKRGPIERLDRGNHSRVRRDAGLTLSRGASQHAQMLDCVVTGRDAGHQAQLPSKGFFQVRERDG